MVRNATRAKRALVNGSLAPWVSLALLESASVHPIGSRALGGRGPAARSNPEAGAPIPTCEEVDGHLHLLLLGLKGPIQEIKATWNAEQRQVVSNVACY